MNRQRLRCAARRDAAAVSRIVEVQERQIEALKDEVAVLESVLTGVAELYVYDHVDPVTGRVCKGWQCSQQ